MPLRATYWTDRAPTKTRVGRFGVDFQCFSLVKKSKNETARELGAAYNVEKEQWVPIFDNERAARNLRPVTKVRELKAINGSGFYLTLDDTNGDPDRRERYMTFCIFQDVVAVCGDRVVMSLVDPKGDLLPYMLRILRSVEFVDKGDK